MADLLTKLDDYGYSDIYAFHMPGHKRRYDLTDFFEYYYKHDVKEVADFDSITKPEGILEQCMKDAARLFDADESFYLINGVKAGIFAAVSATVPKGGRLLATRFSEKAVYDIANIRNIKMSYIYTATDVELGLDMPVTLSDVQAAVEKDKFDAVLITSPTICGYSSDIKAIADYLHEKKIPLIVDESYGAHFSQASYLPMNANKQGADLVISGVCNTLPAPRQTALLHINGNIADRENLSNFLNMYQASEPSYVLMAGLDDCITYLETGNAEDKWQQYIECRESLHESLADLKYLGVRDHYTDENIEVGKMLIYSKSTFINSTMLYDRLIEKHHIQPELVMPNYVLLSFTLFDTKDGFDRLNEALHTIDMKLGRKEEGLEDTINLGNLAELFNVTEKGGEVLAPTRYPNFPKCKKIIEISDIEHNDTKVVNLIDAEGEIAAAYVGIPRVNQMILVPGEEISKDVLMLIGHYKRHGFDIAGLNGDYIEVVRKKQI